MTCCLDFIKSCYCCFFFAIIAISEMPSAFGDGKFHFGF